MRRLTVARVAVGLGSLAGATLRGQDTSPEDEAIILFSERVQVAADGRATDVSFATTGLEIIQPNDMVWIADPTAPGIAAVASRPIKDTAKAGEVMGRRGESALHRTAALHVGPDEVHAISEAGMLVALRSGWADSVRVGRGIARSADLDVSAPGLVCVLWGDTVSVYGEPPSAPLWRFGLEKDVLPAVAVAISSAGEVFVAGRGEVAVAVYGLDDAGSFHRTRAARAADLKLRAVGGLEVSPFMLLPVPGREGWVDQDRFVFVTDSETGAVVVLERSDLKRVGRWDVRSELPGAAPGRLDLSNRGQIAYVDTRSGAAWVLPTRVTADLVSGAKIRWRVLDPQHTIRVQGGDTLKLEPPKQ